MQKIKVVNRMHINSDTGGSEREIDLTDVVPALSAKHASVYLQVHEVDSDTRITIASKHSPEPVVGWTGVSDDLYDSGDATGISEGLHAGDPVDVTNVDQLLLVPRIQKTSSGSGEKSAVASIWLLLKPF